MKRYMYALILIFFVSCSQNGTNAPVSYINAEIYYQLLPPWGDFRIGVYYAWDVLNSMQKGDYSQYKRMSISDEDSLAYISCLINAASLDTLKEDYCDPVIIAFLHAKEHTDTLVSNAWTQCTIMMNDKEFTDSTLVKYIVDGIGAHDKAWQEDIDDYFYDGYFHPFPKGWLEEPVE